MLGLGLAVITIEWKMSLRVGREGSTEFGKRVRHLYDTVLKLIDMSASNVKHFAQLFKGW